MKLSVIVCTYNREKYIYNVLQSIAINIFPKEQFEIIVINNNSTEQTEVEYIRAKSDFRDVHFRYYFEKQQGLSYARNRGIKEAKGDIIIFVDDDVTADISFLQTYYDFFIAYPDVYAAGGIVSPIYEGSKPKWMNNTLEQLLTGKIDLGTETRKYPSSITPFGVNCAFRKEIFSKIGLFNVHIGRKGKFLMAGEESELFEKMKQGSLPYLYTPNIIYHHISNDRLTLSHLRKLTFAMGVSEKIRTLQHSKFRYAKRLILECRKWGMLAIRCVYYFIIFKPETAARLFTARWNYSKGLVAQISKLEKVL